MKVQTNISRTDLALLSLVVLPRLRSSYVTIAIIACAIIGYVFWRHGLPQTPSQWSLLLVSSIVGGVLGLLIGFAINLLQLLLASKESSGTLGVHSYEITTDGLVERTVANYSIQHWSGVSSIRTFGPYLLVEIPGHLYHLIPKRSFESDARFQEFARAIRHAWRSNA